MYADENILYFNEGSGKVSFCGNEIGILCVNLNIINLDDTNYEEDDPDTIILIRLLVWYIKLEKCKGLKKKISEELMPTVWHSKRWWNLCISEDEEKNRSTFYWRVVKVCVGSVQYGGIETFCLLRYWAHHSIYKDFEL